MTRVSHDWSQVTTTRIENLHAPHNRVARLGSDREGACHSRPWSPTVRELARTPRPRCQEGLRLRGGALVTHDRLANDQGQHRRQKAQTITKFLSRLRGKVFRKVTLRVTHMHLEGADISSRVSVPARVCARVRACDHVIFC